MKTQWACAPGLVGQMPEKQLKGVPYPNTPFPLSPTLMIMALYPHLHAGMLAW